MHAAATTMDALRGVVGRFGEEWLRVNTAPDASVGTHEVGIIGY